MYPKKFGKKRRMKIGIRPQLIILVGFSSLVSLLILAIVTGVYTSNNISSLRSDRLQVIAQLKSVQIEQSLQFIYYSIAWVSQRSSVTTPLTYYRAGNTSSEVFASAQSTLNTFLASSETFVSAKLYSLDLSLVAEAQSQVANVSQPVEDALLPLGTSTTLPSAVTKANSSNAIPTGYLTGPIPNSDETNTTYYLGITVPIYTNSSMILRNSSVVAGYLTVIANAQAIRSAFQSTEEDYTSVVMKPFFYNDNHRNDDDPFGYELVFEVEGFTSQANTLYPISRSEVAQVALTHKSGTSTKVKAASGAEVAIGFTRINVDANSIWSIIIEQPRGSFFGPVKKLTDIMIGVVIGIGVFMCLITFPLAFWFVVPITKLKEATESITRSKKEKDINGGFRANPSPKNPDGPQGDNLIRKRDSVNTVSSGNSTVYSTGIRLPDRIPQSKKLFKDELTELSEAFNIMTEELEKQYIHLEDRVKSRTKELEASKIEAEAANEAKTVFIANISHELRTPLNGILGMTSIAMAETDPNQIQDALKLIHRSGELLLHILTELLTYSKNTLNRSKLEKSNFQILEVVYQVKSIFGKLALDQRVNFKILLKPNILRKLILIGDSNRIIQVVMNLVSNSLKFTPVDGHVDVTFKLLGEYDHEASRAVDYETVCLKKGTQTDVESPGSCYVNGTATNEAEAPEPQKEFYQAKDTAARKDSVGAKKAPTSTSVRSSKQNLNEDLDTHSLITLSTAEYEENLFKSQFSTTKPLPGLPPYDSNSSVASSHHMANGERKDKGVESVDPHDTEEHDVTDQRGSNSEGGDSAIEPPKIPLPHMDSNKTAYSAEFHNSELVKNNKVFKMRKLYNPTTWVIQIEVRDTGSGIEPALQEKVFEPFIQGDQTLSRSYGGTGLGLSICRQLAKMMHGTLTLRSTIGKGSTFRFTLPLTQSGEIIVPQAQMEEFCDDEFNVNSKVNRKVLFDIDEPSSPVESQKPSTSGETSLEVPNQPMSFKSLSTGTVNQQGASILDNYSHLRILVAEDNSVNQEVIKRMLKLEGFSNITMAANGAEAVEFVKESFETMKLFDAIFMDVQMPKMDGLTATKIIRNNLRYRKPIIALTAFADESNVKECLSSGMSGFLSKPIKRTNLRKIVTEISPDLLSEVVTPNTHLEEEKVIDFSSAFGNIPDSTKS